jgi:GPH family glycoside/pentoside/hexuronide:cation symporter
MAETQTARAVATINWSYLLAVIVPMVLAAVLFYFMKVEEENKRMKAER